MSRSRRKTCMPCGIAVAAWVRPARVGTYYAHCGAQVPNEALPGRRRHHVDVT